MIRSELYEEQIYYELITEDTNQELLVLVHPLGISRKVWDTVIAQFKDQYDLLVIDLPGHGKSQAVAPGQQWSIPQLASVIITLITSLGYKKTHYVGTSIGGAIGQEILLSYPKFLSSLLITNTHSQIGSQEFWGSRAKDVREKGLRAMASGIVPRWFAQQYIQEQSKAMSQWQLELEESDVEGYAVLCEALGEWSVTDRLSMRDQSIPVLCVAGAEDPAMPLENMKELAQSIGKEPLVVMPIGHVPSLEAPDQFNQLLGEWLSRNHK